MIAEVRHRPLIHRHTHTHVYIYDHNCEYCGGASRPRIDHNISDLQIPRKKKQYVTSSCSVSVRAWARGQRVQAYSTSGDNPARAGRGLCGRIDFFDSGFNATGFRARPSSRVEEEKRGAFDRLSPGFGRSERAVTARSIIHKHANAIALRTTPDVGQRDELR